ncbi:MAG: ATP-binding cassette domain-containing protein, partial [Limnohabitans sp.]
VQRGTIHCLIGPNGSGKSTMMNVLTGIYVPTAGKIEFSGATVVGPAYDRDRIPGLDQPVDEASGFTLGGQRAQVPPL